MYSHHLNLISHPTGSAVVPFKWNSVEFSSVGLLVVNPGGSVPLYEWAWCLTAVTKNGVLYFLQRNAN